MVVFQWELVDGEITARGDGVARIASPDSVRLDFFLGGGMGGGAAVLIGAAADEIAGALDSAGAARAGFPVERARTLEDAVAAARRLAQSGDVVLLSPACASFDMFSSADERGEKFAAIVRSFTS